MLKRYITRTLLIVGLLGGGLLAHAQDDTPLADTIANTDDLATLNTLLNTAALTDILNDGAAEYTIFAPKNAAFDDVSVDDAQLATTLQYHVIEGVYTAEDLANTDLLETLIGAPLRFALDGDALIINSSVNVVQADIGAANGVIHIIDAVLIPNRGGSSVATATPSLTALISDEESLEFTDSAFEIVDVTDLVQSDELTIFAPNGDAWAAVPDDTRVGAVQDPNVLAWYLLYHTLPQRYTADELVALLEESGGTADLPTALPETTLTLTLTDAGIVINDGATVVEADIEGSNGVLHIVDGILTPPIAALPAATAIMDANAATMSEDVAEGPALAPLWEAFVAGEGAFNMPELDTADDFFVTVIDPFAPEDDNELYGIEIINWVGEYTYTTILVESHLTADVLLFMAEQDPTVWENISDVVLGKLPPEVLAELPEDVQARVE